MLKDIEDGIILNMDTGSELIAYTGAVDSNNLPDWVPDLSDFTDIRFNKVQIEQIVNELCEDIEEDEVSVALKTWMKSINHNDEINFNFSPPGCPLTIGHIAGVWTFKIQVINSDLFNSIKNLIGDENINYIPLSEHLHFRILRANIDNIQFSNETGNDVNLIVTEPFFIQAQGSKNEINTGMSIYYGNRVIWDSTNPDVIYIIPKDE